MTTMTGFKRIVLATDGSDHAQGAVEATIALGGPSSAEVLVVHVRNIEVHPDDVPMETETRGDAAALVLKTVEKLRRGGMVAEARLCEANGAEIAKTIAHVAREFSADLVILGSRGLSDWQSIFKHSVSHQVLAAVSCPVLVVRGRLTIEANSPRRVLLGIAGGADVAPCVRAAVAAAQAPGSEVMVVHVAQATSGPQGFAYVESPEKIQATMASALGILKDSSIKAQGVIAHASPVADSVAEIAQTWKADIIVVGSSRMGDLAGLILGSVSHSLLHTTTRPVLIAESLNK
ncbi:MAG TPA: universal stress protein [Clostridia bacterium]|nr:universal stress protein [Clostridia bacterium]